MGVLMNSKIEENLYRHGFDSRQKRFWSHVAIFFDWCHQRLDKSVAQLRPQEKKQFNNADVSETLLNIANSEISKSLISQLSWVEHFHAVRRGLTNSDDYDAYMQCRLDQQHTLPIRIRNAVENAEKLRREQIHTAFFANVDFSIMTNYCRAWKSQNHAHLILISLACRELTLDELDNKTNETGWVSLGSLPLNERRWALRQVKVYGYLNSRGVPETLARLANADDRKFFIELGQVLKKINATGRREAEVQWDQVNDVAQFLVSNWCEWPVTWDLPPLCLFENKALSNFCSIAMGKKLSDAEISERAIRKWVSRLRLCRTKTPKVGTVKLTPRGILFAEM